ncbi:hypothetical protein EE612_053845 [Oryza sativa]|nr:hypothetical protein EE612_053845 [Oryza sativa]
MPLPPTLLQNMAWRLSASWVRRLNSLILLAIHNRCFSLSGIQRGVVRCHRRLVILRRGGIPPLAVRPPAEPAVAACS